MRMKKIAAAIAGAGVIVVVFACGGQESFACGSTTCSGDEVCLHPCCGGALPQCVATDDAGACPEGTSVASFNSCGNYSTTNQCLPPPCTPPAPYCAPKGDFCQGYQQDPQNCFQGCA